MTHPFTKPLHGHMEGVGEAPCARSTAVRAGAPSKRPLLAATILGPLHPIAPTPCGHHPLEEAAHFPPPGDAYPCADGSSTQLSIGPLNHGARARTPAYVWVIGMAVCRDQDMAVLATIWFQNLQGHGRFFSLSFLC